MKSTQIKTGVALSVIALALIATAPTAWQHWRTRTQPIAPNTSAVDPSSSGPQRLGAPSIARVAALPEGQPLAVIPLQNFFERLNAGDMSLSMLSRDQADAFISLNKGNAESVVAAYRVTHDLDYLRQAATNHSSDPAVLLRVVAHDAFPESRRAWLDQFKKSDPDNALAHYLSAREHLQQNERDAALADMTAAAQAPAFRDYVTDHMQSLEEIYLASGRTAAEAKALATHAVELPHVSQAVETGRQLTSLIQEARSAGDNASVETLTAVGMALGRHLQGVQDGGNLLGQMVGVAVQQRILNELDPQTTYAVLGGMPNGRLTELAARERAIRQDSQFIGDWIGHATESELVSYFDRLKLYGESSAIQWLRNRSPRQN